MPLRSTILKVICPYCEKVAKEASHYMAGANKIITYECGHTVTENYLGATSTIDEELSNFVSSDGRKLYPFQITTVKNVLELANGRALINHEMGLGKTVIDFATLKTNF